MRAQIARAALAMSLLLPATMADAQTAPAAPQAQLPPAACAPGAIGVARTVEIDAKGGPRLGNMQYPDIDFLGDGEVVLTFDDGPLRPYTRPVLEALAAHCSKATFFMVGRMAVADAEMAKEVARRGHTIATHTWSHRNLRSAGPTKARAEIELGVSAISKAVGEPISPFFRFPYLSDPKDSIGYLKARDIGIFSIDVDSVDFRTRNPADVQRRVLNGLAAKRKGIILFHDIQPSTAGALKGLLDELAKRNFKVVHLVPKGNVQTLPEYDAEAEQILARKKVAAVAQPLATRSMVWPISTSPESEPKQKAGGKAGLAARTRASTPAAPAQTTTPAPVSAAAPAAEPPPAAVAAPAQPATPRVPRGEERSWQERVFSN